jgi:hypothetical protein
MPKDYIPQNAGQFHLFVKKIIDYTDSKLSRWGHIPEKPLSNLKLLYNSFSDAYQVTLGQHTSSQIMARNIARLDCTRSLRLFVNQYLRFEPVTNVDRSAMGIPNKGETRKEHKEVNEVVDFDIRLRNIRELRVYYQQKGTDQKAKPAGYDGAVIIWHIGEQAPVEPTQFMYHNMAKRTPHTLRFEEKDRGKKVWIALCWQNGRGIRGQWSQYKNAVIP